MPLIQRVPWTVQPQVAAQTNASTYLGSLPWSCVHVMGQKPFGAASPVATINGGASYKPGSGGVSLDIATAGTDYVSFGANAGMQLSTQSGVMLVEFTSASQTTWLHKTSTSNGGFSIGLVSTGKIEIGKHNLVTILQSSNSAVVGLNAIAWSYNSSTGRVVIALNGVVTSGTSVQTLSHSAVTLGVYSEGSATNSKPHKQYLFAQTPQEVFANAALAEITRTPISVWQLFAPLQRTIWAPAAAGTPTGTLATTNANDASAASGTTTVTGTLATTNANDTLAASGSAGSAVTGTLATTNANDTLAASGSAGSAVTGTLATTNANDTSAASGTTTVTGTVAYTNANDTAAASGWAGIVSGTLAVTNAADTLVASGSAAQSETAQNSGGELPWSKTPQAKKFREQEELRKQARALIEQAQRPEADISALTFKAEAVSLLLQEDIARLERDAQAYQERLAKQAKKATQAKLMNAQNDARATRMLQAQVIDAQLKAQALVEELDVVFMAVMLAEMGD